MTPKQQRIMRAIEESPTLMINEEHWVEKRISHGICDEADDLAVTLIWRDSTGCEWEANFAESSLDNAQVENNEVILKDILGETVRVTAYRFLPSEV